MLDPFILLHTYIVLYSLPINVLILPVPCPPKKSAACCPAAVYPFLFPFLLSNVYDTRYRTCLLPPPASHRATYLPT